MGERVLLDVAAAAARLNATERFVRRLIEERRIRFFKIGKYVRLDAADLDAFVEAAAVQPARPLRLVRSAR